VAKKWEEGVTWQRNKARRTRRKRKEEDVRGEGLTATKHEVSNKYRSPRLL
jgi:hypothetical protein